MILLEMKAEFLPETKAPVQLKRPFQSGICSRNILK